MADIGWDGIWREVAARLAAHRAAGRGHLLTEDVVRLETVLALEVAGVPASRLSAEVLAPELNGGKLDLTVDGSTGSIIEFKYPRDSRTGMSPDTMTFGELVRDFLRVAVVAADDRWVVQVVNPRLAKFLTRVQQRHQLAWATLEGQILELRPDVLAGLPETALRAIGAAAVPQAVIATCVVVAPIDDDLVLYAYSVDAVDTSLASPPPLVEAPAPVARGTRGTLAGGTRDGARREIITSAQRVVGRSGRSTFTMSEVIADMRGHGTWYAESTIRTMIAAHMCADATGLGVAGYSDLIRVSHGVYRLA